MIPIPLEYSLVTAGGSAYKAVICENCKTEFVYLLKRRTIGCATGVLFLDRNGTQERAAARADVELRHTLARCHDPVPCPACGWYQRFMLPLLQRAYHYWMFIAGAVFVYFSVLLLGFHLLARREGDVQSAQHYWQAAAWVANLGCGLIFVRKVLSLYIRPNDGDPEARKQLGQSLARTRKEFERMLANEQSGSPGTA